MEKYGTAAAGGIHTAAAPRETSRYVLLGLTTRLTAPLATL